MSISNIPNKKFIYRTILNIGNAKFNPFVRRATSLCRMHTSLHQHFISRKATSFIYVRSVVNEVDCKQANEALASLVMKLCLADINEKIQAL